MRTLMVIILLLLPLRAKRAETAALFREDFGSLTGGGSLSWVAYLKVCQ